MKTHIYIIISICLLTACSGSKSFKASEYIKAGGSANEFIAATIPSRILSPSDAEYVRTELNRATPGSSSSGW